MIAGVVIDKWKLPIFKKHLDGEGYVYTEHPGITKDTLTLKVEFEKVKPLHRLIETANKACAN